MFVVQKLFWKSMCNFATKKNYFSLKFTAPPFSQTPYLLPRDSWASGSSVARCYLTERTSPSTVEEDHYQLQFDKEYNDILYPNLFLFADYICTEKLEGSLLWQFSPKNRFEFRLGWTQAEKRLWRSTSTAKENRCHPNFSRDQIEFAKNWKKWKLNNCKSSNVQK